MTLPNTDTKEDMLMMEDVTDIRAVLESVLLPQKFLYLKIWLNLEISYISPRSYIRLTILPLNHLFNLWEYNVFLLLFFFLLKNVWFSFEFILNDILDVFKLPEHMDNKVRSEFTSKKIISIENWGRNFLCMKFKL